MAELATAGSVVGLISLGIQSCQGLTSYYSAWKSYDEQIGQTYRNVDELKITCENLERELQRITVDQNPAVQQVVRLIISCQDGVHNLRYALGRCHSTEVPHSLDAKLKLFHARALYPFRKQTLQTLKETVHSIQGNLGSALQILQFHLSIGHEQRLMSMARNVSDTETAVNNNRRAILALSSPIQAINQAFPLVQQQTEDTAITIRAVHDEVQDSRQSTQEFQETVLQKLTRIANQIDNSSSSLETNISMTLDHYSTRMNQMKHDLHSAHTRPIGKVAAELKAIDQSIRGLQISMISKPSLMHSVCAENDRFEDLLGSDHARGSQLASRHGRSESFLTCSCKPKHYRTYSEMFSKSPHFELISKPKWKGIFEIESTSHHPTCPLFASSASTTMAVRIKRCGALLAGAIEASITITRGAGGLSISPVLRCAHVVAPNSSAFALVGPHCVYSYRLPTSTSGRPRKINIGELETSLDISIHGLVRLFREGKASPYDVDLEGNTLLHVASGLLSDLWLFEKQAKGPSFKLLVQFLKKLGELCVPLNWTNDYNLTFMNSFLLKSPNSTDPRVLVTSATCLLNTGAEFARFPIENPPRTTPVPVWMTKYTSSVDIVDALEDNPLTAAIWHQSEQELNKALLDWPHLINQTNGLGNSPLHLAVGWSYGVRELLKHSAYVDNIDQNGHTPLYYAIYLGFPETVSLLIKADCSLQLVIGRGWPNVLWDVSQDFKNDGFEIWGVSQETRVDVLESVIASLAERRRDLQSRLAMLQTTAKINSGVFRDDRILDEYAEYAEKAEEDALRGYDHIPLRASTLLVHCRTVYHTKNLKVEIAERLWRNGFHDIDVHDEDGWTPLMLFRYGAGVNFITEIALCSWLIQKGAKLHQPQHSPLGYGPHPTLALHYVAANIGYKARYLASFRFDGHAKQPLKDQLSQLSTGARLLLAMIFSDKSHDDCVCACSSQGCLASTMMLKVFESEYSDKTSRKWSTLATKYLTRLVGTPIYGFDWLVREVIRYRTFSELELRHTCCRWEGVEGIAKLDPEECLELREEDHEKIELLEGLLQEFEEHMGNQDLMSFILEGYWVKRMDQILEERSFVDEEALREIGVVLRPDETEGSDGND